MEILEQLDEPEYEAQRVDSVLLLVPVCEDGCTAVLVEVQLYGDEEVRGAFEQFVCVRWGQ